MTDYDLIADDSEKFFDKEVYADEDIELKKLLPYPLGLNVLDIGCGTGLGYMLLKMKTQIGGFDYLGIDPSGKMLEKFMNKTVCCKTFNTEQTTFEEFKTDKKFDIAISTYGSISYVEPSSIEKLKDVLKAGGQFFLVFYKDDYKPITHEVFKDVVQMTNYKFQEYRPYLEKISKDLKLKVWHNYIIAEGTV